MGKFRWGVVLVLIVEVCLFAPSFSKYFCGDSLYFLSHVVKSSADLPLLFTSLDDLSTYRPITHVIFSYGLYPLFGFYPLGYHVVALGVHLLTTLLIFLLLRRVASNDAALWAGLLFFGAHSTMFYLTYDATCLPDYSMGLLAAGAFAAFVCDRRWASLFLFTLALFCKESAVMIPVGIAALAYMLHPDWRTLVRRVTPFAMVAGVFLLFNLVIHEGWLYPGALHSSYRVSFVDAALKLKYLPWLLNLPSDWFRQRRWMWPAFVLMIPPISWLVIRAWRTWNREAAVTLAACGAWVVAALLPVIPVAQAPMKHNLHIPVMAAAVAISRLLGRQKMGALAWAMAGCLVAGTAFHVHNDLTNSWVGEGSDVTKASLDAVQRAHPTLPRGASLFILPAHIKGNIAWYFDDEALFRRVYSDHTLKVYYADLKRLPPPGFESRADSFVFAYFAGRLYDVTREYKAGRLDRAGIDLLDLFPRAAIQSSLPWSAQELFEGRAASEIRLGKGDDLRDAIALLPQTSVKIPVDVSLPAGVTLSCSFAAMGKQRAVAEGEVVWQEDGVSQTLNHVSLEPDVDDGTWWDGRYDLSRFAGHRGNVILRNTGGKAADWIAFSGLRIGQSVTPARNPLTVSPFDSANAKIASTVEWLAQDMPGGVQPAGWQWRGRTALYVLPSTEVAFPITIPQGQRLRFSLSTTAEPGAVAPDSPVHVEFRGPHGVEQLFHRILDPQLDSGIWWDVDVDVSRLGGESGELVFRNDAGRAHPAVAWSRIRMTTDPRVLGGESGGELRLDVAGDTPIAKRGITLLDETPSESFDRMENYPSYNHFETPTGGPYFLWQAPARPPRLSAVTIAGARTSFAIAKMPDGAALEFGVAHGTGIGDGVRGRIFWDDGGGRELLYERLIYPWMSSDFRDAVLPMGTLAGRSGTLTLEASSTRGRNPGGCWLVWSGLRIVGR